MPAKFTLPLQLTAIRVVELDPTERLLAAELLRDVGLDPAGFEEPHVRLFGARVHDGLAGVVAYERGPGVVLLRSLAVRPELRGRGVGGELTQLALEAAAEEGAEEGFLLTETAEEFFRTLGWERVSREVVDALFPDSEQVRHVCPASAVAMRKTLDTRTSRSSARRHGGTSWVEDVRRRFPALRGRIAFLDAPGGTQVPQSVIDAMVETLALRNANLGGYFETSVAAGELVERAHAAAARFLGAAPEEIVFGANMTTLNFTLTRALGPGLARGDVVVVTQLDHDANVAPWLLLARDLSLEVRFARVTDDFQVDLDHLASLLDDRTRVVAFPWASNALGTIVDAARAVRLAHDVGALAWIDAVHYAPHRPIDVAELGADVVLCSPYKFFGPHLGVAFGRRDLLERMHAYKVRPAADSPAGQRFETGTQSHEAFAGMIAAIEYLEWVGFDAIARHEDALGRRFLEGLGNLPHVRLWGLPTMTGRLPTFALTSEREAPSALAERLARADVCVWSGHYYALEVARRFGREAEGWLRAGFVHYNTPAEVDRLLELL